MYYTLTIYDVEFQVSLHKAEYALSKELAILLYDNKKEYLTTLTVALDKNFELDDDMQFIDINNNPWAPEFIRENNLGKPVGISVQSGFVSYPLYRFNLNKLEELPDE